MELLFGEKDFAVERFGVTQGIDRCPFGDHLRCIEEFFGNDAVERSPEHRIADPAIHLGDGGIDRFGLLCHRLDPLGEFRDLLFVDPGDPGRQLRFALLHKKCPQVRLHRFDLPGQPIGLTLDILIVRFGDQPLCQHLGEAFPVPGEFAQFYPGRFDIELCRLDLLLQTLDPGLGDLALKLQGLFQTFFLQLCRFDLLLEGRFFVQKLRFGRLQVLWIDPGENLSSLDRLILLLCHLNHFAPHFEGEHRQPVTLDESRIADGIDGTIAEIGISLDDKEDQKKHDDNGADFTGHIHLS